MDFLPRHLLIVGGSYIALEFAQMFRRFGSEVTVIEKGPRLARQRHRAISGGEHRSQPAAAGPMPRGRVRDAAITLQV